MLAVHFNFKVSILSCSTFDVNDLFNLISALLVIQAHENKKIKPKRSNLLCF